MTTTATKLPVYGNATFDKGVRYGIAWHKTGDLELRQPTAELIVDFIRNNILHPEWGENDEEQLIDYAGFLTGWIIGQFL